MSKIKMEITFVSKMIKPFVKKEKKMVIKKVSVDSATFQELKLKLITNDLKATWESRRYLEINYRIEHI